MDAIDSFGTAPDGTVVQRCRIAGGGLSAEILTWGAVIRSLRMDGHAAPLVLGFDSFEPYPLHSPHFGAIAGRYANRIRDGRFELDGTVHQLDRNFHGKHHLHGGGAAFGKRCWTLADAGPTHVRLELDDPAGTGGYPSRLRAACTYRLLPDAVLSVTLEAEADAPTICNLAQHSYFNLDDGGAGDILGHRLTVAAESYLPVDDGLIPTGEQAPVAGTAFDFRTARTIGAAQPGGGLDHNFCLSPARHPAPEFAARLQGVGGLAMEVWTTEPGLQVYTGARLSVPVPGLGGRQYGAHAGVALEPQLWPDSPNRPEFPSAVLRAGGRYCQQTEYRFFPG